MNDFAIVIAVIGLLVFTSHLFTAFFNRTGIPDVLFLIIVGIALGPALGLVSPVNFGEVGPVFIAVTLIVILFEGGMALKLGTLRTEAGGAMALANVSFFVTMGAVAVLALLFTDLELVPALILGAILGSTSEAIVIPLASQLRLQKESQTILSLESSLNDVLSVVITIALIQAVKLGKFEFASVTSKIIASFLVAIALGVVSAFLWSFMLRRIHAIKNATFTTPAFLFVVFGIVEVLGFNGAIAALAFGVVLGNIDSIRLSLFKKTYDRGPAGLNDTEKAVFSEIAFLLRTFFFIYLGISLQMVQWQLAVAAAVMVVAVFALRIPTVRLFVHGNTSRKDASIIAVMVPKGLAAAVLASIPLQQGIAGGELIKNITYGVILFSIVATSVLVVLLNKTKLAGAYGRLVSSARISAPAPFVQKPGLAPEQATVEPREPLT